MSSCHHLPNKKERQNGSGVGTFLRIMMIVKMEEVNRQEQVKQMNPMMITQQFMFSD
jgi:hypothetical protein